MPIVARNGARLAIFQFFIVASLSDMQNNCLAGILLSISSASAREQDCSRDRQQVRWRHDLCAHYATIYVCTDGRWHLTQEELTFLFGYDAELIISRFEREERTITLTVAARLSDDLRCRTKRIISSTF